MLHFRLCVSFGVSLLTYSLVEVVGQKLAHLGRERA